MPLPLTKSTKYPKAINTVAMLVESEVVVCNVVLQVLVLVLEHLGIVSCEPFCHPECMPALHSKLADKPEKPNLSIEKIENDYEKGKFDNFKY